MPLPTHNVTKKAPKRAKAVTTKSKSGSRNRKATKKSTQSQKGQPQKVRVTMKTNPRMRMKPWQKLYFELEKCTSSEKVQKKCVQQRT